MVPTYNRVQADAPIGAVTRRNAIKSGAALAGGLALGGGAGASVVGDSHDVRPESASNDLFLVLDGIVGESQDAVHRGAIDILAWNWGGSNPGTMHQARGGGAGRPSFQDLAVTKYTDASTPVLLQHLATGRHIPSGEVIVRGGEQPVEFLRIELENIIVTGITAGGTTEHRHQENVTLNFARFRVHYTPQMTDGTPGETVEFGFDISSNEAV